MNRLTFIKRLVMGAAAVPAVVAASKATKASSTRKLYSSVSYPDVIRGKVNNREDFLADVQLIKPEDAPLYGILAGVSEEANKYPLRKLTHKHHTSV